MSFHRFANGSQIDPSSFSTPSEPREAHRRPENKEFLRHFGNFSPSVRHSAEDILRKLKENKRSGRSGSSDRDMFFNDCFLTPETMFTKADEGSEDPALRGRHPHPHHPHFRVPAWFSDDQDMKDITTRMSHAPHFATLGRRGGSAGPWRERRYSGGSAMSGTSEDDTFDPAAGDRMSQGSSGSEQTGLPHEIPIRFEAPAPPPHPQQHPQQPPQQQQAPAGQPQPQPQHDRVAYINKPLRTTSAVDATEFGNNGVNSSNRNSRCASAPPEMAEQQDQQQGQQQDPSQHPQPQRFVSKISITPQAPTVPQPSSSPQYSPLPAKFNTVPRPFVTPDPQQQQQYQQQQYQQPQPQQHQYPQQYPQQPQQYQQQPQQYQQQPPPQQQPPLGFFPPQPDQHWQFGQQQQQQHPQQQYPQQEPQRGGQRPSVVRNIPIFVEGRDDPIDQEHRPTQPHTPPPQQWTQTRPVPQQPPQPQHQPQYQPQPQPQHQPQYQPQPQPQQQAPHPTPRQKRQQAHQPTPPPQQPIPHPVPMPMPDHGTGTPPNQAPQMQTEQDHPQAEPQQPSIPRDPRMVQIEKVSETVKDLAGQVDVFKGGDKKAREFLYLDEMLTRALLQLDNVDPEGCDDVRQARRAVIKDINAAIAKLEAKAKENKENQQQQQQQQQQQPQQEPPPQEQQQQPQTDKDTQPQPTPSTPTPNQDPAAPPTPATTQEGGEEKKEEKKEEKEKEEKMDTEQEGVKSGEPAEQNQEAPQNSSS